MIRIGSIAVPGEQGIPGPDSYDDAAGAHVFIPRPRRESESW